MFHGSRQLEDRFPVLTGKVRMLQAQTTDDSQCPGILGAGSMSGSCLHYALCLVHREDQVNMCGMEGI